MVLAGRHLDIVTICSNLMCVGFSVDYVSHISYHFFAAREEDEELPMPSKAGSRSTSLESNSDKSLPLGSSALHSTSDPDDSADHAEERLYKTLDYLLIPTVQAAASTIITASVIPIFIPIYIYTTFLTSITPGREYWSAPCSLLPPHCLAPIEVSAASLF